MAYTLFGEFDKSKARHGEIYYAERSTTLDCRGDLRISPLSYLGFSNIIITTSHNVDIGQYEAPMITKKVYIDDYAWVTSGCILYNCHVEHHGIVSVGSVVKNMTVKPYTIVSGNPAVVIAEFIDGKWVRV